VVMVEPSFLALMRTPSISPSSAEETLPLKEAVCASAPIAVNPANTPTKLTVVKNLLDVIFRSLRADVLPWRPANMKFAKHKFAWAVERPFVLGDRASVADRPCAFATDWRRPRPQHR
jgi:hypothetical protein